MLFTRPDGTLAKNVDASRRIMPFIMKDRTESAVYFEQQLDLTKTEPFIAEWNAKHPELKVSVFHVFVWSVVKAFHERPRLNRFVMGSRLWERDGIWLSFSAKKRLDDDSPIVTIKRRFDPMASFEATVKHLKGDIQVGRSDEKSHIDKELGLFLALPAPLLRVGVKLLRWLDRWNLLPGSFIHPDPMYASMFVANLGSVGLEAAFHHLYEWGNCPFFAALGKSKTVMTPEGPRRVCTVRYTFDERVEDGLYCATALELVKQRVESPESDRVEAPEAA
jgi:hypothetical protein